MASYKVTLLYNLDFKSSVALVNTGNYNQSMSNNAKSI